MEVHATVICIVGDIYFPRIDWSNLFTVSGDDKQLIDALGSVNFSQLVGRLTRFRQGQEPSLIDLVIVNNEFLVSQIDHDNPIGKSDNVALTFDLYIYFIVTDSVNMYRYNLIKGRYNVMQNN